MAETVQMKSLKAFQNDENEGNIRRGATFTTTEARARMLEQKGIASRTGATPKARAAANANEAGAANDEGTGDAGGNPSSPSPTGEKRASRSSSVQVRQQPARKSGGRGKTASKRSR